MILDKNRIQSITLADQVALKLKDDILNGVNPDGTQLPSVSDLAKKYGVGISTIREAVKKLQALDLVEIVHGRGIFIHKPKIHLQAIRFSSFSETIRQSGKVPGSKTLDKEIRSANPQVAAQLALKEGSFVYYLKRLRFADDDPIALELSYLPADRFPGLLELYNDPMSLYHLLQTEYNVRFSVGLQTLEAKCATEQNSYLLNVALYSPILFLSTIAYDVNAIPVEYGESFYRGDKYKYISHLER